MVQRWALLMLLAWLPGISFFGHWTALSAPLGLAPVAAAHSHGLDGSDDYDEHAAHCHVDVGTCGSEGSTGAPMVSGEIATLRGPAPAHLDLVAVAGEAPAGWTALPATPPPRAA